MLLRQLNDNPSIMNMCLASYQTVYGSKSITFTVIKLDSVSETDAHYETVLDSFRESLGKQLSESVIGPKSFKAEVNKAGVGSFVDF